MKSGGRADVFRTENVLWVNFSGKRRESIVAIGGATGGGIVPWPLFQGRALTLEPALDQDQIRGNVHPF